MDLTRAFLVDDEPLALLYLESVLKELMEVTIAGTFTSPVEAIQALSSCRPDVIFLDIDMPEMNGLQAAEKIHEICPDMEIIFVTAYNQYAVDAFELSALDYVLKPLQRRRLEKTVERLEKRLEQLKLEKPSGKLLLRCLNMLQYEREGEPAEAFRWRTLKTEELFCYLLHHRGSVVNREALIDLLFPDSDDKRAMTHLYTIIYQIRKLLADLNIEITISKVGAQRGYILELNEVTVDVDVWQDGLRQLGPITADNCEAYQQLMDDYTGHYFSSQGYLWAESERHRLSVTFTHHALQLASFYVDSRLLPAAIAVYQRVLQLEPYMEEAHKGLIHVYTLMGDRRAAEEYMRIYERCLDEG